MELVEGDAFNRILLERSRSRVRSLRFFEEVEITERQGSSPDRAIVEVSVAEQPTGELSFSAGFSSGSLALPSHSRKIPDLAAVIRSVRKILNFRNRINVQPS